MAVGLWVKAKQARLGAQVLESTLGEPMRLMHGAGHWPILQLA